MDAIEPLVVPALLVMGTTTVFMRIAGFWLMGRVPLTPRVRRVLEALPGCIVVAIVLPVVARTGPDAAVAVAAAAAMMVYRRNEFLAVTAGVATAILARSAGI